MIKANTFSWRALTSLLLAFSFLGLALSGIILYLAPQCSVAESIGWSIAGMSKEQWASLHMTTAVTALLLALVHLFVYNWKPFMHHIKNRKKAKSRLFRPELMVSVIVAALFIGGSLAIVYPFSLLPDTSDTIKNYYREQSDFEGRGAGRAGSLGIDQEETRDLNSNKGQSIQNRKGRGEGYKHGQGERHGETHGEGYRNKYEEGRGEGHRYRQGEQRYGQGYEGDHWYGRSKQY